MTKPVGVTNYYRNVDPSLARIWVSHHLFDRQRKVRPHHVAMLAQSMRLGDFREGTPISFAILNGQRILINGQHTLLALIQYGKTIRLNIEEHQVDSKEDLAKLYMSFDIHLRRTPSDMFTATDFAATHGLTTNMVDALSGAIPIIVGGFLPGTRGKDHPLYTFLSTPYNKQRAMDMWADPARAYFQMFYPDVAAYVKWQAQRAMVAAVGILTFRYQPVAAKEFWTRIARRENLTQAMPEYRLVNYLQPPQDSALRQGFIYSRAVAAAWNAAFEGRTLARGIVARGLDKPFLLAGTPFNGRRNLMYFAHGQLSWNPVEVAQEIAAPPEAK